MIDQEIKSQFVEVEREYDAIQKTLQDMSNNLNKYGVTDREVQRR